MNEINETFTKVINGFECSITNNIYELQQTCFDQINISYRISKNNKFIEIEFYNYEGEFNYYDSSWSINSSKCEADKVYSEKEQYIFYLKIYKSNQTSIWQILQDEWHKRFDDER